MYLINVERIKQIRFATFKRSKFCKNKVKKMDNFNIDGKSLTELLQMLDQYFTLQEEIEERIKLIEGVIFYKAGYNYRRKRK